MYFECFALFSGKISIFRPHVLPSYVPAPLSRTTGHHWSTNRASATNPPVPIIALLEVTRIIRDLAPSNRPGLARDHSVHLVKKVKFVLRNARSLLRSATGGHYIDLYNIQYKDFFLD